MGIGKTVLRVALGALVALMAPLVASRVVEGWQWEAKGFVLVYVLFFGTGMAYALIARKMAEWTYKTGSGLALVTGFALGWANMIHMSEADNPMYVVYFGVLVMGGAGAWLVRLEAEGMARDLFAMATVLAAMGTVEVLLSRDASSGPKARIGVLHGGCAALFTVSGLLFRQASLAGLKRRPV